MRGYTPGYTDLADRLMRRRSAESHAWLVAPRLREGAHVLDCGCGPGTITLDLARLAPRGRVVGLDIAADQLERARTRAREEGVDVELVQGDVRRLPFPDATFDVSFANAVLEHLAEPAAAVAELVRVTRPGGVVAASSPDFSGLLLAPPDPAAEAAIAAYEAIQRANGGDLRRGRRIGRMLVEAGLADVEVDARFEVYESSALIADYLAERLEASPAVDAGSEAALTAPRAEHHAGALRRWAAQAGSAFCQPWVAALGVVGA